MKIPKAATGAFTPRTYPDVCIVVILICCVIGLVKEIIHYCRSMKNDPEFSAGAKKWRDKTTREKLGVFMPWICICLCVIYAVLFDKVGFIPATIIIPPIILILLGDMKKPMHYVYVYGFCAVMYVVFTMILGVHLP